MKLLGDSFNSDNIDLGKIKSTIPVQRRHSSVEEIIRNINNTSGFIKDNHTQERMKNGLSFLNNMVNQIKKPNSKENTLDDVVEILCLRENVDFEEVKIKTKKSKFSTSNLETYKSMELAKVDIIRLITCEDSEEEPEDCNSSVSSICLSDYTSEYTEDEYFE
jgi:hypothetical protein